MTTTPDTPRQSRSNARIARWLAVISVAAFGFGFALVPLYDVLCRVTGIGGKPVDARAAADRPVGVDRNRWVTVELMSTAMPGAGWTFEPTENSLVVHPGEIVTTKYRVRNPTNTTIIGQAVPSVSPGSAAAHLHKIDCFCFKQQALEPGVTRELPVTFYVSPELPAKDTSITLSYAFYPVEPRARAD